MALLDITMCYAQSPKDWQEARNMLTRYAAIKSDWKEESPQGHHYRKTVYSMQGMRFVVRMVDGSVVWLSYCEE